MGQSGKISAERVIAAGAPRIFEIISDPSMHPLIDGSHSVVAPRGVRNERLVLGSSFEMSMHIGVDYKMVNTVVEFEKDRLIAWEPAGKQRWRYELDPIDEHTTKVTETFDPTTARARAFVSLFARLRRHRSSMERSLANLESLATGPAQKEPEGSTPHETSAGEQVPDSETGTAGT